MKARKTPVTLDRKLRWTILLVISGSWFFILGVRLSFPVLLPHISAEFDLNLVISGLLMSTLFGGYAIGQIPGGVLCDRVGERFVLVVSMLMFLIGVTAVVFLGGFSGVVTGIFLLSIGSGIFAPARFTILSDLYSDKEGTAHGIAMAAGDIGNTILPVLAGIVAVTFYWRLGVAYSLPFLVILVIGLARIIPAHTSNNRGNTTISWETTAAIRDELSKKRVLFAVSLLLIQSIIFQGYTGMYPTYLIVEKGIAEGTASVMLGLFFGTAVVVHLLAGIGSDRFGIKSVMSILLSIGTVALISLPFVNTIPAIIVVTALSSAPLGVITITLPYLIGVLSDEVQGTGFGIIRTMYLLAASVSPLVVGALGSYGYFDSAFFLLGAAAMVALVISQRLPTEEEMFL